MSRTVAIGVQDFTTIRERNYFYVDKTSLIKEWWESGDSTTLITRPGRFGKTLNMSMLKSFFSIEYANRGDLFEGLSVWTGEKYRKIQGTYPVISLSFANVKENTYLKTEEKIKEILRGLYKKYLFLLENDTLTEYEKIVFRQILNGEMKETEATSALHCLSEYLEKYYGKKVIILLDEYDTPMQEAYYEVRRMFRSLIKDWFREARRDYNDFIQSLLTVNLKTMNTYINKVALQIFSYFDTGKGFRGEEPERFYHGFVLGLLVELSGRYVITSNRESGFRRYDVMLEPKDKEDPAYILEFKTYDGEEEEGLQDTVQSALDQIEEKQYEDALIARGIAPERIHKYGFAFEGKKVLIGGN